MLAVDKLIHEFLVVRVHLRDHIFNIFHLNHLLGDISQRHVLILAMPLQRKAAVVNHTVRDRDGNVL